MAQKVLSAVFLIDGALSVGFGLASWLAPQSTFGTNVDLAGAPQDDVLLAALGSISVLYFFVGITCALAAALPVVHRIRFAVMMALAHLVTGLKGLADIGREWLIGNPWPDIVIHSAFLIAYLILAAVSWRRLAEHERA